MRLWAMANVGSSFRWGLSERGLINLASPGDVRHWEVIEGLLHQVLELLSEHGRYSTIPWWIFNAFPCFLDDGSTSASTLLSPHKRPALPRDAAGGRCPRESL